jgi:hypothetical protein
MPNYKQNKYIDITSLAKKVKPSIFKHFERVFIHLNYVTYCFYGIQKNGETFSIVRETLDYPKNKSVREFTLDNDCITDFIKNSDKGRFYIFSECELDFIEEAIDYLTRGEDTIPDTCFKQSSF